MATKTQDVQEIVVKNGANKSRVTAKQTYRDKDDHHKNRGSWDENDGKDFPKNRDRDVVYGDDGYDTDGYDRYGYDRHGYDRKGYDRQGCDKSGYDKNGYDKYGYNESGYNKDGYDRFGYDEYGYDRDGYNRDGYDSDGYDRDGYDVGGYHRDGYEKPGRGKNSLKKAFETPFHKRGYFDGEIDAHIHEHGGYSPVCIIRTDQKWGVVVKWKTRGSLTRMICGKWCLHVNLESMGPGPELSLPAEGKHIDLEPCKAKGKHQEICYECHLDIPCGVVTADHCSTPYKLVTTLTYIDPCGRPGPIAGYVEGQIVQFIEA